MRGTHTFGHQGEQGRISRVNGAKAVKQHEKDFSLQEKVASERLLVTGAEGHLKQEWVIFKFKLFVFMRREKDLTLG